MTLPFFGIGMKTDVFQSCGHCWVFQICWHMECSTFTASSFSIWNSSTGIPSPPLALFVAMLFKAHLTSHSRMSGSRWVITPSWLSESWRSFLYSSSMYSCLAPKNWCFWTVVLEKTLESPLDCKEIQPVHSEGDQPWDFFGRNDAKAETPVLGHLMRRVDSLEKILMLGGIGGRRKRDDRGWDGWMTSLTRWT